jgi:hypothetical protein
MKFFLTTFLFLISVVVNAYLPLAIDAPWVPITLGKAVVIKEDVNYYIPQYGREKWHPSCSLDATRKGVPNYPERLVYLNIVRFDSLEGKSHDKTIQFHARVLNGLPVKKIRFLAQADKCMYVIAEMSDGSPAARGKACIRTDKMFKRGSSILAPCYKYDYLGNRLY